MDNFIFNTFPLENVWMKEAQNMSGLNHKTSFKLLQKLLLHNIIELGQITLPNGLNFMSPNDFKNYHSNPTKLINNALNIAQQLFCQPPCLPQCQHPCPNHHPPKNPKRQLHHNKS